MKRIGINFTKWDRINKTGRLLITKQRFYINEHKWTPFMLITIKLNK